MIQQFQTPKLNLHEIIEEFDLTFIGHDPCVIAIF